MSLLGLIIFLVLAGVGLWLINAYVPMQQGIKTILNVVVIIVVLIIVANAFGLMGSLSRPVPQVR
jgi:hypothetical protein